MKKITDMEKEMEQILKNLNNTFAPITEEIDEKMKFLQDFVGDNRDLSFKEITMDDLK